MRFLELAHVDGDDVLLAAIERFGERERGFRLADARRAGQHEHADGLVGIVEARARRLDALRNHLERVALPDHAAIERIGEIEHGGEFVLEHPADGNAGPVRDHARDDARIDARQDQRRVALQVGETRLQFRQAREALVARGRRRIDRFALLAQRGPQREQFVDHALFLGPARFEPAERIAFAGERRFDLRGARADIHADIRFARDDLRFHVERLDAALAVLDLRRRRMLADRDARAGGVEQRDGLVGQLARGNVAMREPHGRFDRLVEQLHAVMAFEHGRHAAQHAHGLRLVGFVNLHHLKAPRERGIFLDVLLVLRPRRRADGARRRARAPA